MALSILNPNNLPIFLSIAIIGFLIAVFFFLSRHNKKRAEEFRSIAASRGFSFKDKDPLFKGGTLKVFNKGHSRKASNIMDKEQSSISWKILDYRYTVGYGRNSRIHNQTIAIAHLDKLKLPKFAVYKEHIFHKIGNLFGYKDIDFDMNPEFSKKYFLKGDDEPAIRSVFNQSVLSYFESRDFKATIEAEGNAIVYYRLSKRIKPADLETFLSEAREIIELFR